jgi:hypothetical protein
MKLAVLLLLFRHVSCAAWLPVVYVQAANGGLAAVLVMEGCLGFR